MAVNHYWTVDHVAAGSGSPFTYTFPSNPNTVVYSVCHIVYVPGTNCVDSTCTQIAIPGSSGCNLNAAFTYTAQGNTFIFTGNYANSNYTNIYTVNGTPVGTTGIFTYQAPNGTTSFDACYIVSIPGTICADTFCQTLTVSGGCSDITRFLSLSKKRTGLWSKHRPNTNSRCASHRFFIDPFRNPVAA